jgi:hypothetical protein
MFSAETMAYIRLRNAVTDVGALKIRKGPLRFTAFGQQAVPVAGARITVDRGESARRLTATRVALTGVFALALKKDVTKLFITVEGTDGSAMVVECPAKKEGAARRLGVLVQTEHPAP